jgi:hypothetical protein
MGRQQERIKVGAALVDGKFRFISVTQMKLFDPESEGCNRKWAYQYKFHKKLAKTGSLKDGADTAEKLEHYLKTGEDVLPLWMQPAKLLFPRPDMALIAAGQNDLQVEKPLGPNFPLAVFLRDAMLRPEFQSKNASYQAALRQEMRQLAGLVVHDIPFDGAPDVRYFRDVYIGDDGLPYRELPGTRVVKLEDLKTTSRIWPQQIMSGENAGKILPGYAKTAAQVCDDTQMLGYARRDCDAFPEVTHFRLAHIYAQTKSRGSAKRSGIISREEVLHRWEKRGEDVVGKMVQVATADRIEDIEPSISSCDAYTHLVSCGAPRCGEEGAYPGFTRNPTSGAFEPCFVCKGKGKTQKGCGHRYYCPLANTQVVQSMYATTTKETNMSLFNSIPGAMPPPPTGEAAAPPPPPAPNDRNAVEQEKEKLRAADVARIANAAQQNQAAKLGCGAQGCGDGCAPGWVKGDSTGGFLQCPVCKGKGGMTIKFTPEPGAVIPPDAPPPPDNFRGADPVPPEARAEITDPALKQRVEEHAAAHAAEQAKIEAQKLATSSVWCTFSGSIVPLSMENAMRGKYACSCGKEYSTKKEAVKTADGYNFAIPRHKPKNKVEAPPVPQVDDEEDDDATVYPAPPPPPPAPPIAAAPPPPPPPPAPMAAAPPPPPPPVQHQAAKVEAFHERVHTNGAGPASVNGNGAATRSWLKDTQAIELLTSIDNSLKELLAYIKGAL